jgi:hypothetical protein
LFRIVEMDGVDGVDGWMDDENNVVAVADVG